MKQIAQIAGEARYYQQATDIGTDTITTASWTVSPAGPTLSHITTTSTSSKVMVATPQPGTFVLKCVLVLTSGQIIIGEERILVSSDLSSVGTQLVANQPGTQFSFSVDENVIITEP